MKKKRKNEIQGVVYLTLSLFILISLVSYQPQDPSFTTSGGSIPANLMGLTGAFLSDGFLTLFGVSSYLLPLYLLILGVRKFKNLAENEEPFFNRWNSVGTAGLFFALPACLNLVLPGWISLSGEWILIGETGGFLGKVETALFIRYFGNFGSYLFSFSLLLLSMMFLTHFSPWSLTVRFISKAVSLLGLLNRAITFSLKKTKRMKENARQAGKSLMPKPKPKIIETSSPPAENEEIRQEPLPFLPAPGDYQLPPLTLLEDPPAVQEKMTQEELGLNAQLLAKKLLDFGIEGNVSVVHPGPVITLYEFEPAPGIKVNKITNLSDDLALAMKAMSVRIVAPIPGKSAVGIEIPNRIRETVSLKHLITPNASSSARLPLYLGKDISGQPVTADFTEMPHLLVAGATGSGKSVALNAMVLSLLFSTRPGDLKMMMIDPKMLELTTYNDIPHLIKPVITQPREAARGLQEIVMEMQKRYRILAESGVRNIEGYHRLKPGQKIRTPRPGEPEPEPLPKSLPYLVVIIDELADLMMTSQREVEDSIGRLAQMGRAAGIHLLLATQRPSVDVLTGVIKANFSARISFQVSSKTDSRTILDANGAEQLLGKGDMLYLIPGTGRIMRIHGPYVSEEEIKKIVSFIKAQAKPNYEEFKLPSLPDPDKAREMDERDELYEQARELVISTGQASASLIQRRLRVGYPRAARMIEMMEEDGVVGQSIGGKQREVLIKREQDE